MKEIPAVEVRAQLERIVASEGFVEAGRLSPFLRFLVEAALGGEAARLKESVLGLEVFQRPAGYDPRTDPIVRVEARRLRARLEEYYRKSGDRLRIELPKGTYVPVFSRTEALVKPGRRWALAAIPALPLAILAVYLIWGRQPPPRAAAPSVVVLPLQNLSADPDNEYFSDGLTTELIDALTKVEGLRVIAWNSAAQFKGKPVDYREIGQKLQVGSILEGSVRKSGNRLRITARLSQAGDGQTLWSQTYQREAKDVFAIQEEISRAIVNALRVELRVDRQRLFGQRYTENLEAYNQYLRCRSYLNRFTEDSVRASIRYCELAIRTDPHYAPAYAQLAATYTLLGYYRAVPSEEAWRKARELAGRAIAIDPTLAEAHASLGFALGMGEWKWPEAERELKRGIELNPASSQAHAAYAIAYLAPMGKLEEAEREMLRALDLDPLSFFNGFVNAYILLARGKFEQAIAQYSKTLEVFPDFPDACWDTGMAYALAGRPAEAERMFLRAAELRGQKDGRLGAAELGLLGRLQDARAGATRYEEYAQSHYVRPLEFARVYALVRDHDPAFAWLEKALAERDSQLIWLKIDRRVDNLRADPRYAETLRRIGLSP